MLKTSENIVAKGRWFLVKPLVSVPQSLYPWTELALAQGLFPGCVCVFILPAGSNLGVKGSLLFLHKQRLWDEKEKASRPNPLCLAVGHCSMPVSPQAPRGHHAGPGNQVAQTGTVIKRTETTDRGEATTKKCWLEPALCFHHIRLQTADYMIGVKC